MGILPTRITTAEEASAGVTVLGLGYRRLRLLILAVGEDNPIP